jgi:hypothetical protein
MAAHSSRIRPRRASAVHGDDLASDKHYRRTLDYHDEVELPLERALEFYTQLMPADEAKRWLRDARGSDDVLRPLDLEASAV